MNAMGQRTLSIPIYAIVSKEGVIQYWTTGKQQALDFLWMEKKHGIEEYEGSVVIALKY